VTSIQNCIANTQSKAGFVLGVSAIELGNGTIKGRHCETFDYSGQLYENDSIIEMGSMAEKTAKKLERHGIITLLDMRMMTTTESSEILGDKDFRVSDGQIKEWQKAAQQENEGSVPSRVRKDHRKDENPYL
jgi:hypothetical protein